MAEGQVSVGASLAYAWTLWRENWRSCWGVLALCALAWTVFVAGQFAGNGDLQQVGFLGVLLTQYPLFGAMFRAARGAPDDSDPDSRPGTLGLQWRRMEFRLVVADLLVSAFVLLIAMLFLLAFFVVLTGVVLSRGMDAQALQAAMPAAGATAQQAEAAWERLFGPNVATAAQLIFLLIVTLVPLFLSIRLSLSLPASALSGRIAVLRTWRLTRGQFWRMFVPMIAVRLPLLLSVLVAWSGAAAGGAATSLPPEEVFAYALLSGVLVGAVTMPLTAGLQAYFYRRLGPLPAEEPKDSAKP